jgi:hypothetical protein
MIPERRVFEDDPCPVPDNLLGRMYRSSPHGLSELIATIPPEVRGMLAVYCYRRAHLASIGLAIAASCEENDLTRAGGNAGSVLFAKSRESAQTPTADPHASGRRKVTLASGSLRNLVPLDDEIEDDEIDAADIDGDAADSEKMEDDLSGPPPEAGESTKKGTELGE